MIKMVLMNFKFAHKLSNSIHAKISYIDFKGCNSWFYVVVVTPV